MFYLFTFYFILFLLLLFYDYFSMSVLVYKWYRSKSMFSLFSSIAIPPAVLPWNRVTWTYFWYISWSPTSLQPLNHLTLRIYSTVSSLSWLKKYAIWFALKGIHISWNNVGANLRSWILLLRQKRQDFIPPEKLETASKYKHVFSSNEWLASTHLLWDCWRIHDLKLWNLVKF